MINSISNIKYNSQINFKQQYARNPLDKYKLSYNEKMRILSFPSVYDYIEATQSNWEIYQKLMKDGIEPWLINTPEDESKCSWKMHIYADNKKDYALFYAILTKYILDNDISAKIIEPYMLENVSSGSQKGKAFVIYPKSVKDFRKIARDLDYIIKINYLEQDKAEIKGDRKLGSTNRIFYRYEYNSGKYKNLILDLKNSRDYAFYCKYYEKSREDNYLADDMSNLDDPFLYLL